jgi:hypothetical protein
MCIRDRFHTLDRSKASVIGVNARNFNRVEGHL